MLWYLHGVTFLSRRSIDASCFGSCNFPCMVCIHISYSSILKSLTIGEEANSKSLLLNRLRNGVQIIVFKHTAQSSCAAGIFLNVWHLFISQARPSVLYPASIRSVYLCQHISDQALNSVSFKALGRPCLPCLVGYAMPGGARAASTSGSSPAAAVGCSGLWETVGYALLKCS